MVGAPIVQAKEGSPSVATGRPADFFFCDLKVFASTTRMKISSEEDLPSILIALDSIVSGIEGNLEGLRLIWRCAVAEIRSDKTRRTGTANDRPTPTNGFEIACRPPQLTSQFGAENRAQRATSRYKCTIDKDPNTISFVINPKPEDATEIDFSIQGQGFSVQAQTCPPTKIAVRTDVIFGFKY